VARRFGLFLPHLRLPFQLTLAPIFLWGALLSGGRWGWETFAAFLSLHLFLYPAATAFNSVYDKDEGPVGGIEAPPPVPPGLLGFSLAVGAVGVLLAVPAGAAFLLLYTTSAGWAAAAPLVPANPLFLAGAASAALTAVGLYPATQVFQVEEDRARGDATLAVTLGPARALRLGALLLLGGGTLAAWAASRLPGGWQAAAVALGYLALAALQLRLAATVNRPHLFRRAMRVVNAGTAGFLLFLLALAL